MSEPTPLPASRAPADGVQPPPATLSQGPAPSATAYGAGTSNDDGDGGPRKRRRRGSRGGRNRSRAEDGCGGPDDNSDAQSDDDVTAPSSVPSAPAGAAGAVEPAIDFGGVSRPRIGDTRPAPRPAVGAPSATTRVEPRPRIGDTRPSPVAAAPSAPMLGNDDEAAPGGGPARKRRRRGGRGRVFDDVKSEARSNGDADADAGAGAGAGAGRSAGDAASAGRRKAGNGPGGRLVVDGGGGAGVGGGAGRGQANGDGGGRGTNRPVKGGLGDADVGGTPVALDEETLEKRRGRERNGRPVGRYLMAVHVAGPATQIAVLEGRNLIEHYVSRPQDDVAQIDGNVYLGRVQNVLPGMEAAFVDIGTPKNAVLYRGDVRYDTEDVESAGGKGAAKGGGGGGRGGGRGAGGGGAGQARIEELLKPGQTILCQVTKNPIAHKGARLTQEVSLPGRFVVLIPNSDTYGISKRLGDDERKRLRRILDEVKPAHHGIIVRTASEGVTADELRRDVLRLVRQWEQIEALAARSKAPALLYREPDMAVRVIREEFNKEYRGVVIDDATLHAEVREYVASISPELADRVELFDPVEDGLPLFERHHVHEQVHKAIDRKVWLPSGGSLIIERTEALTVIDVNTGKNVGTSNLEETVYRNNLEAADEIARQLRLRDIGGIIVIDFIDMEIARNRVDVMRAFREGLSRDKTRTQVFDISELGLVEMTRKRISEGLVESLSTICPHCVGRGLIIDESLL